MTPEPQDAVLDILKGLRREMRAGFTVSQELSVVHHRLDMLTSAYNDLATTHAIHGEISALHSELDRVRQHLFDHEKTIKVLEPEE
jgi:hypothetical protein